MRGWLRARPIDFRRKIKIIFRQSLNRVRPDLDNALSPTDVKVRVMSFGLGDRRDPVRERHRFDEIFKRISFFKTAVRFDPPTLPKLAQQRLALIAIQRRRSFAARFTGLICKTHRNFSAHIHIIGQSGHDFNRYHLKLVSIRKAVFARCSAWFTTPFP